MSTLASLLMGALLAACGAEAPGRSAITEPPAPAQPAAPPVYTTADTARITVDNGVSYQAIAGFGGTTLPLVYGGVDYLGALRPAALEAAFRTVGISRGLLQIGLTEAPAVSNDPFGQRRNDNDDPFVIDPAGFNFAGLATLRSAITAPGAAYGFASLELGPMIDLRYALDWMKAVRVTNYNRYLDEAAESVFAVLQQWRAASGQTPTLIHLFNEPTTGNTELGSTSTQEVVDLVKRIGTRLRAQGFPDVKFIVPNEETMNRSREVAAAILADPVARPFVGAIGFHQYPYGSVSASPRRMLQTSGAGAPDAATRVELEGLKALAAQYGVSLWMTEVTEGPGTNDFAFDAIENVLARAIHIHDVFRYGGANAFFGMNTLWDSRSHAEHFAGRNVSFISEASGVVLVDGERATIRITGMGYAIGHYARWLAQGALRLETTSEANRVLSLGFRDATRGRLVVVSTNADSVPRLLRVRVAGATAIGTFTGEVSYGTVRLAPLSGIVNATTGFSEFVAPPRSVVTLAIPVR